MTHAPTPHDRTVQRQSSFLVVVIGVIVLVVVAVVILRSQGAEEQPETRRPNSPSALLAHSSTLLDEAAGSFKATNGGWPGRAWVAGRALKLTGGGKALSIEPGLDEGVRLTWYRGAPDRFAYCLTHDLRALTVVTSDQKTTKREVDGACPAPDLDPELEAS